MPSWDPDTWYWFQLRARAFWMLTVGAGVCCSAFWCLKQGRSFVSRRSSLLEHMRNTHELDPLQVYVTSPPNHLSDLGWDGMGWKRWLGADPFPSLEKGSTAALAHVGDVAECGTRSHCSTSLLLQHKHVKLSMWCQQTRILWANEAQTHCNSGLLSASLTKEEGDSWVRVSWCLVELREAGSRIF